MAEFDLTTDLGDDDVVFLIEVPPLPHGLRLLAVGRKGMRHGPPKQHVIDRLRVKVTRPNAARILKLRDAGVLIERLPDGKPQDDDEQ